MKKSIYRWIIMILGIFHLLPLCLLPYAKLEGLLGGLGQLAGALGVGDSYPETLTGLAILRLSGGMGVEASGVIMVLVLLPVIFGIVTSVLMLIRNDRVSYIIAVLLSVISAGAYGAMAIFLSEFVSYGYQIGVIHFIFLGIAVLQAAVSVVGIMKDETETSSGGIMKDKMEASSDEDTRDGKNGKVESYARKELEGILFGMTGAYAGASIPLKSGETIVIGRDPAICGIVIKGEQVSRRHCLVMYHAEDDTYSVLDVSSNGVYDGNGGRLPSNTEIMMESEDEIRIGRDGDIFRFG